MDEILFRFLEEFEPNENDKYQSNNSEEHIFPQLKLDSNISCIIPELFFVRNTISTSKKSI